MVTLCFSDLIFRFVDKAHIQAIKTLAAQMRRFHKRKRPFYVYHGSTNSTRKLVFKASQMVDTSGLNRVLNIDTKTQTALVEPNVAMDELVASTLKHGLVPPVVPEFPGITVGGGQQGGAGESSSFKWGGVHDMATWIEIITPDGRLMEASTTRHTDLFWGSAGSYGTLGVVTALKIKLIPATKYVKLTYQPVESFAAAIKLTERATKERYDFIDGIMFAPSFGVIMLGQMTNQRTGQLKKFSRAHDDWFYLHARKVGQKPAVMIETMPLKDYLFRYDRGAFWTGQYAFAHFKVPFNRATRWLLNPFFKTRKMYQALQHSGAAQEHIIQDVAIPTARAVQFLDYVDQNLAIYPLWLCPLPRDTHSPLLASYLPAKSIINIGVWGPYRGNYQSFMKANRALEAKVKTLGGRKWLYAHTYYSETEFWQIYDHAGYDKLRQKYHATYLPSVYEKVRVKKVYPISYRAGVKEAIRGHAVEIKR